MDNKKKRKGWRHL